MIQPARVLVTRPQERSVELGAALEQMGYAPLYNPLLAIVPTGTALPASRSYQGIVFTSASAIPFFPVADVPVFTVGEATAAAARAEGFPNVTCGGGDVAALARYLGSRADLAGKTLLYPGAIDLSRDLPLLLPGGPAILRVPVYEALPQSLQKTTIQHLYDESVAWIVLFSTRTALVLQQEMARLDRLDWTAATGLGCLSPKVAEPLAVYRWRQVEVAARPDQASLLACIKTAT